jgi:hypothetical protein
MMKGCRCVQFWEGADLMADAAKEQVFTVSPWIRELRQHSSLKRDPTTCQLLDTAIESFGFQDIAPTVDVLAFLLDDKNADVIAICLRAFAELFLSKHFDFFLSANHSTKLLHTLVRIMNDSRSLFADASQCLTHFLMSPNQQLYVHGDELSFTLESLLLFYDRAKDDGRRAIELMLRRFLHNIATLASRNVDEFVSSDYRDMIVFLIRFLLKDVASATSFLVIDLIESTVFDLPRELEQTTAHRQILLVEIPQLFIQSSLAVSPAVFERLFGLFGKFVELGDQVVTSFPLIIDNMITPAIESGCNLKLRALQMLDVFNHGRPNLLMSSL